jgi:3-deoxy-manno-octulosonate cytidylyltransferase (CMP-KDO synthetase)
VASKNEFERFTHILNVQGDEPLVAEAAVRGSLACLTRGEPLGTAAAPLDRAHAGDPGRVKVVIGAHGRALYFSRAAIPFDRDGAGTARYRQHIGVYAYAKEALERWVRLAPVPEERWEGLEQLRPLAHGIAIGVALIDGPVAPGVDTPADVARTEADLARHLKEVGS